MELSNLYLAVRRWAWLILLLAVVMTAAVYFSTTRASPHYQAQVKLQSTAPQEEDVAVYDQYRSVSLRDEMIVLRNNLSEVLQSQIVRNRTARQLGLPGEEAKYGLEVQNQRDADFTYVKVAARTGELAEEIADTHVEIAIAYYGEIRAKPAEAARDFFAAQLNTSEKQLNSARQELADFQAQTGIFTPEAAAESAQKLVDALKARQDLAAVDTAPNRDTAPYLRTLSDGIARRNGELQQVMEIGPRYALLQDQISQAVAQYKLLQGKHQEAGLKAATARTASYIQVVEPAAASAQPVAGRAALLIALTLLGSLGLGVLVALVLEYGRGRVSSPTSRAQGLAGRQGEGRGVPPSGKPATATTRVASTHLAK